MVQLECRHHSHDVDAAQETFQRHQEACEAVQKLVIAILFHCTAVSMEQLAATRYVYLYQM
jgi:hypothetical protein